MERYPIEDYIPMTRESLERELEERDREEKSLRIYFSILCIIELIVLVLIL